MKRLLISCLTVLVAIPAYAHGGRTNAAGCHNSRHGYHCHGGKRQKEAHRPVHGTSVGACVRPASNASRAERMAWKARCNPPANTKG